MAFALFILKSCFFFLFGGSVCFALFNYSLGKYKKVNVLISMGLGPVFASLILYYLLVLIPGLSSAFYLGIITLAWLVILYWKRTEVQTFFTVLSTYKQDVINLLSINRGLNYYFFHTNNVAFLVIFGVFAFGFYNCIMTSVIGHDPLEYMVQGKYFFDQKEIIYQKHNFHSTNGFYYVGLHGWSFPLQVTLEYLFDDLTFAGYDLYFRLLTPIYGVILLSLTYYLVKLKSTVEWGVAAICLLVFAKGFFIGINYVHIDAYRIFLIALAIYSLIVFINKANFSQLLLLSFVAGNAAFTHSLSVFITVFIGIALFLFVKRTVINKIKLVATFAILVIAFGGIHYLIDVLLGTGWIFGNIDFY